MKEVSDKRITRTFTERAGETALKIIHILTVIVAVCTLLYRILPVIILGENYVFTIHDNMDFFPGFIRAIRESGTYFTPNKSLSILNGLQEKYLLTNYNFHESICLLFGYVVGETINKVLGTILGFFSMRAFLNKLFKPDSLLIKDVTLLVSAAYATLPCAPTRIVPFALIPLIILFFMHLKEKDHICRLVLIGVILPFFLCIRSSLLFVLGFWFVGMALSSIIEKKVNLNLAATFLLMTVSSVLLNIPTILVALSKEPTNRALILDLYKRNDFKTLFCDHIHGQYHAPTFHDGVLMWFLIAGTAVMFIMLLIDIIKKKGDAKLLGKRMCMLFLGFLFWILSAALMAGYESGLATGIKLIDSFAWGRVQAFDRIIFVLMFMIIVVSLPKKQVLHLACLSIALFQIYHISTVSCFYNDDFASVRALRTNYAYDISYKEFISEDLFDEIKEDIHYHDEGGGRLWVSSGCADGEWI